MLTGNDPSNMALQKPQNESNLNAWHFPGQINSSSIQCHIVRVVRRIIGVEAIVSLEHILFDGHNDKWA